MPKLDCFSFIHSFTSEFGDFDSSARQLKFVSSFCIVQISAFIYSFDSFLEWYPLIVSVSKFIFFLHARTREWSVPNWKWIHTHRQTQFQKRKSTERNEWQWRTMYSKCVAQTTPKLWKKKENQNQKYSLENQWKSVCVHRNTKRKWLTNILFPNLNGWFPGLKSGRETERNFLYIYIQSKTITKKNSFFPSFLCRAYNGIGMRERKRERRERERNVPIGVRSSIFDDAHIQCFLSFFRCVL